MHSSSIKALAMALALAASGSAAARASDPLPAPPAWLDPFCAVRAHVVPWNASADAPGTTPTATYRVVLFSQKPGSTLDAHLTLVDDSGLYLARVRSAALTGTPYEQRTQPYLVTFPKPVDVQYAFVHEYFVDDSAQVACPTEVTVVGAGGSTTLTAPAAGHAVTATLSEPMPALACGKIYTPPLIVKNSAQATNLAGQGIGMQMYSAAVTDVHFKEDAREDDPEVLNMEYREHADVVVFLGSDGAPVNTYLSHPTNTNYDKQALVAAQTSTYAPATFLCSPTVATLDFQADYKKQ